MLTRLTIAVLEVILFSARVIDATTKQLRDAYRCKHGDYS